VEKPEYSFEKKTESKRGKKSTALGWEKINCRIEGGGERGNGHAQTLRILGKEGGREGGREGRTALELVCLLLALRPESIGVALAEAGAVGREAGLLGHLREGGREGGGEGGVRRKSTNECVEEQRQRQGKGKRRKEGGREG